MKIDDPLSPLAESISELQRYATAIEQRWAQDIAALPPESRASAMNLAHYVGVRQHDIRALQQRLHEQGLSSLGRMEAYVMATLNAVSSALARIRNEAPANGVAPPPLSFTEGRQRLAAHAVALFGSPPDGRDVRTMVTMSADDPEHAPELLRELLRAGMNLMRINCSKDDPKAWKTLIAQLRAAEKDTGIACRVAMDLAGPNPRTIVPDKSKLRLTIGDRFRLGPKASKKPHVVVGCTLPDVLSPIAIGSRVTYDDGMLEGIVRERDGSELIVEVTFTAKDTVKLKSNKGLNFPTIDLGLNPLTDKDRADLSFIVDHADIVSLSFIRSPADVQALLDELETRNATQLGVILKIETASAFACLPRLLLAGLRHPPLGVMVARGDMAIELGFDRLAEAQEEILWMCEAAHIPVVWATQVLEGLAKSGLPRRGEVSDAVMAGRAECVMLNKGQHIIETVRFLDNVLRRMQSHQRKRLSMLRKLHIADTFSDLDPTSAPLPTATQ